jgi:hypothetical protein
MLDWYLWWSFEKEWNLRDWKVEWVYGRRCWVRDLKLKKLGRKWIDLALLKKLKLGFGLDLVWARSYCWAWFNNNNNKNNILYVRFGFGHRRAQTPHPKPARFNTQTSTVQTCSTRGSAKTDPNLLLRFGLNGLKRVVRLCPPLIINVFQFTLKIKM